MPGVLAAATGSDWSSGGSLLTFYFPVALFIIVAASLYVVLTRPHTVPGRKPLASSQAPEAVADHDHEAPDAGSS